MLLYAAGVYVYARTTRATDAIGRWGFVSLAAVLAAIYMVDALVRVPPPSVMAICVVGLAMAVVFPAWAWWADRHRAFRS
jgi:hypothetical protein